MYIYVRVMDEDAYRRDGPDALTSRIKARLEQASGEPCLVVFYQDLSMALIQELKPRAVVMSGFGRSFQDFEVSWFTGMDEVLHHADLPILCFCGSHQLLGFSFTQDLGQTARLHDQPIRKLEAEEDLPRRAGDLSDFYLAEGFFPIWQVKADPLFVGLPPVMMMRCSHYCEVKQLPPAFELLATSKHCRIEAMRHATRPIYGTQFHAELYEAPFYDGRTLLRNFAAIVKDFWRPR
ncbi:MAG: glutamine amidotransferase-related protein [Anaerolineae bacterium]